MRNTKGFSIIELIIVVAMISVLIGIATPSYLEWRANTIATEAAQQLARDILGQRTEAKRENATRRVSATVNNTTYTLESLDEDGNVTDTQVISLPNGTLIAAVPSVLPVVFSPPYGTITEPVSTFTVAWASDPSIDRDVNVVGVMGKVVIQ